ncbi:MAG: RuBisCO accumulation factor 1, partial [Cyanobacteria bacterium J06629_19]
MTATSSSSPSDASIENPAASGGDKSELDQIIHQLRRKEGTWVSWGQSCQALQKAKMSTQEIFEATGFEPIQQNQLIVASQVFASMLTGGVSDAAKAHYQTRGSDSLYEFRILPQDERAAAADFAFDHGLDSEQVKDIVKALRDFSYSDTAPPGFEKTMGDAAAYYYWRLARQQSDLQARSKHIAQSLRFATSDTARSKAEKLLTDFTVVSVKEAPRLPIFRLEEEADSPVIVPVAGQIPLMTEDYKQVPAALPEEPFGMVKFSGTGAWVPVPGWLVILKAEDPVALLAKYKQLPNAPDSIANEDVLVIVDRAKRQWDEYSYFVTDGGGQLEISWFAESPQTQLLGGVVLIMRPKKIFDKEYT